MLKKISTQEEFKIPSLNGLRALSILIVILQHFNSRTLHRAVKPPWLFFFDGFLGVNIFFVISGYLITTLFMRERLHTQSINLQKFYIRRTLRIFPAYYFLLMVYFILQKLHIFYLEHISWLTSLTYTKCFYRTDWETNHLWSLSVEEFFYLIWPVLFKLNRNNKYNFLFVVIAIVPIFRILDNHFNTVWMDSFSIFQRVDAIVFGCLTALYYGKIKWYVDKLVQKSKTFLFLPLLTWFLLYEISQKTFSSHFLNLAITGVGRTYGTIANMAIVFFLVTSMNYKNLWFKFLNLPVMNFLGKISYSLYLWQQIFFSVFLKEFANFPVNILGIVIMALFSYYVVEKPILSIKRKYETRSVL